MENNKKLGIKKKKEKFGENFAEFLKKFQSASFIENMSFFILNTAFYRAEYGLLSSKTWQHCSTVDMYVPEVAASLTSNWVEVVIRSGVENEHNCDKLTDKVPNWQHKAIEDTTENLQCS